MRSKMIGGILMIVGTSIGGGMLALPVVNAATGFWQSSLFLFFCWAIMLLGAFYILEASFYLPPGKHMLSMAQSTLGNLGVLVTWLSYLFLLYTLLSAYISGGGDILGGVLAHIGIKLSLWQSSILFTLLFGIVTYGGIYPVDLLNRVLMLGKLSAFLILVFLIAPQMNVQHFQGGDYRTITTTIMVLITSFGFAIIVPNLRAYFSNDVSGLKKVIWIGSIIPLVCYWAWDAAIMGSLSTEGDQGLVSLIDNEHTNSLLSSLLSKQVKNGFISTLFDFFSSTCMLTAFLGVALCLISFLGDGLNLNRQGRQGIGLFLLTFVPPLFIAIAHPGLYIRALNYAGIFCVILLLLLPALMVFYGRKKFTSPFTVPGGAFLQSLVILISFALIINTIWH